MKKNYYGKVLALTLAASMVSVPAFAQDESTQAGDADNILYLTEGTPEIQSEGAPEEQKKVTAEGTPIAQSEEAGQTNYDVKTKHLTITVPDECEGVEYEFSSFNGAVPYKMTSVMKKIIEKEAKRLKIDVSEIESLTISTEGNARLKFADTTYIAQKMTRLKVLDITNADFFDDTYAGEWLSAANIDHTIPKYAFGENNKIEKIYPFSGTNREVETKFTNVENDAFAGTKLSGDIVIPKTVKKIAGFNGTQITGINKEKGINYFDGNIEFIGQAVVYNVPTFTGEVVFGDKVKQIDAMAFMNSGISGDIVIGGNIETVGSTAFKNCQNIKSVCIGENVKKFETRDAFSGCTNLKSVIFKDGSTADIGQNTFADCENLEYIYCGEGTTYGKNQHNSGSFAGKADKNVVLNTKDNLETCFSLSELNGGIVYVGKDDILDNLKPYYINVSKLVVADMNGGKLSDENVYAGKERLAEPTREGYTFDGWYDSKDFGTALSGAPQKDKTYYAKWNLAKPVIEVDGTATKVYDGKDVTLSVPEVEGARYQWQKDGNVIANATSTTYTVKNVADSGSYKCRVTVGEETQESAEVTVSIAKASPALTLSSNSGTSRVNRGPVTFTYEYDGDGEVEVKSDNPDIADIGVVGNKVTLTLKAVGTAKITVSAKGTTNCEAAQATYDLTVQKKKSSSSSDTSAPTYGVSTGKTKNGEISTNPAKAEAGDKVTVTVKPDSGYQLDKVTVKDKDGNTVKLTKVDDNEYTFTMPKGKVSVDATFVQKDAADDNQNDNKDNNVSEQGKVIKLQIGSRIVNVDNEAAIYDVAPVIRNDRTLVPIRVITETLGGKVDWNGITKVVTLNIDGREIKMTIGKTLEKYGVAPVIIDGRTFVPVRFVADELGATIAWDDATKTVTITKIEK